MWPSSVVTNIVMIVTAFIFVVGCIAVGIAYSRSKSGILESYLPGNMDFRFTLLYGGLFQTLISFAFGVFLLLTAPASPLYLYELGSNRLVDIVLVAGALAVLGVLLWLFRRTRHFQRKCWGDDGDWSEQL